MLNPLSKIKEIRRDSDLTSSQKEVLIEMVLVADNKTGRVQLSQSLIADLAGINEKTIRRALEVPAVQRYFHTITKTGRWVNLNLHSGLCAHNERYYDAEAKVVKVRPTGLSVPDTGLSVRDTGLSVQPTTFYTTSNTTKQDTSVAALPRVEDGSLTIQGEDVENPDLPLNHIEEPAVFEAPALPLDEDSPLDSESNIEPATIEDRNAVTFPLNIQGLYDYIADLNRGKSSKNKIETAPLSYYINKVDFGALLSIEDVLAEVIKMREQAYADLDKW